MRELGFVKRFAKNPESLCYLLFFIALVAFFGAITVGPASLLGQILIFVAAILTLVAAMLGIALSS